MNQFRIGGVYRARDGEVLRLEAFSHLSQLGGRKVARAVPMGLDAWNDHAGGRFLDDGRYVHSNGDYSGDLLPGELHQVNGEWVTVAEIATPSMTPTLDKLEACAVVVPADDAIERVRPPLPWATPRRFDAFPDLADWSVKSEGGNHAARVNRAEAFSPDLPR